MIRFLLCFGLAFGLVATAGSFTTGVKAEDKKAEKPAVETTPQAKAVDSLAAAYALANHTDKDGKKSPLLMLAAARVIGTTNFKKMEVSKDAKITSSPADVDPKEEAGELIDAALKLAGDDATIKQVAAMVRKEIAGFRGALGGPQTRTGRVDPKYDKTDTYYFEFRGGQTAAISCANLTGTGDIDLKVYDLDNRLIRQDTRSSGSAYVSFVPSKTNRYRVVIVAHAGPNRPLNYRLTTN